MKLNSEEIRDALSYVNFAAEGYSPEARKNWYDACCIIQEALEQAEAAEKAAEVGTVIISRHPAAVEFIRQEAGLPADTPVLASATQEDVRGKRAFGNLPLHLACLAGEYYAVEFDGAPPRGQEYTAEDMRAAGARLQRYNVKAV